MIHPIQADIRVALCEADPALRSGIQTALYRRGIRDIEICKDAATLLEFLQADIIDLVISAVDLPGADFCDLTQQIRQHAIGLNPFTVIVATVADSSVAEVRRAINSGADRVVRKPLPMSDMMSYFNTLVSSRKPFVATESYVGPSRRSAPRNGEEEEELFQVPNTLRSKIYDRANGIRLQWLIDDGLGRVAEMKAYSSSMAICRTIKRIVSHYRQGGDGAAIQDEVDRLSQTSREMVRRYRGTANGHFADMVSTLITLVDLFMEVSITPYQQTNIHIDLMEKLGEAIRQTARQTGLSADVVQKINDSAHKFTAIPQRL